MEQQPKLSPTVQHTQSVLAGKKGVNATKIVNTILKLHPEYVEKANKYYLENSDDNRMRDINKWLFGLRKLFDEKRVPVLHGRIVILGLGLLDKKIRYKLEKAGLFKEMLEELDEQPFENYLSESGRSRYDQYQPEEVPKSSFKKSVTNTDSNEADSVPVMPDDSLQSIEQDQLGRAAYVKYIAKRLMRVSDEALPKREDEKEQEQKNKKNEEKNNEEQIAKIEITDSSSKEQKAFAVHVYGPWGSGKSTVLNFLRDEILADKRGEGWLIVEFNAWRNQKIKPPWWVLMECVFAKARKERRLSPWSYICEYSWRIRMGRAHYFFITFVSVCLLGIGIWNADVNLFPGTDKWIEIANKITIFIGAIVGVWSAVQGVSRTALTGSAKGAESYMQFVSDPMEEMSKRFTKLIDRIESPDPKRFETDNHGPQNRVVIFIDDLDRCEASYVVELLEGFQTLFRKKMVFLIVAADQRWLNACFEEVYSKLRPHVQETGKPLGMLFLEKVFQFSMPMPGIPDDLKKTYWENHLLRIDKKDLTEIRQKAKEKVKYLLENVKTDQDIDIVLNNNKLDPYEKQILHEHAVVYLATPDVTKDIESHALAPFVHLLEPNPRSMKRLVNAYSVNRALAIIGHLNIDKEKIALWTILEMRWPELAYHLRTTPKDFKYINQKVERDKKPPEPKSNEDTGKANTNAANRKGRGDVATLNDKPNNLRYEQIEKSAISKLLKVADKEILNVINGEGTGIDASLDVESIKQCAKIRM